MAQNDGYVQGYILGERKLLILSIASELNSAESILLKALTHKCGFSHHWNISIIFPSRLFAFSWMRRYYPQFCLYRKMWCSDIRQYYISVIGFFFLSSRIIYSDRTDENEWAKVDANALLPQGKQLHKSWQAHKRTQRNKERRNHLHIITTQMWNRVKWIYWRPSIFE